LIGCGPPRTASPEWVKPIHFENETVDWLVRKRPEWPTTLEADLQKIDRHNRRLEAVRSKN
jgi:hypothetical protein